MLPLVSHMVGYEHMEQSDMKRVFLAILLLTTATPAMAYTDDYIDENSTNEFAAHIDNLEKQMQDADTQSRLDEQQQQLDQQQREIDQMQEQQRIEQFDRSLQNMWPHK
jgi:TolA-binding protein